MNLTFVIQGAIVRDTQRVKIRFRLLKVIQNKFIPNLYFENNLVHFVEVIHVGSFTR